MSKEKELLDEAIYAGNLSEKEEEKLYSWIESLEIAKRKADEYEAKAKAFDEIKGYNDRVFEGDLDSFDLSEAVGDIIETYTIKRIIESGEPNAKK